MTLSLLDWTPPEPSPNNFQFNGPEHRPEHDEVRLTGQCLRVRGLMLDGEWRTLAEIASALGDPAASVSAQLRHLRKPRFGSYIIDRRSRGDRKRGLYEYRLQKPDPAHVSPERADLRRENLKLRTENAELRMRLAELEGAR